MGEGGNRNSEIFGQASILRRFCVEWMLFRRYAVQPRGICRVAVFYANMPDLHGIGVKWIWRVLAAYGARYSRTNGLFCEKFGNIWIFVF